MILTKNRSHTEHLIKFIKQTLILTILIYIYLFIIKIINTINLL